MFPAYRQVILDKLKRTAGLTDIEDRIVFERALTPQDIHDRYRVLNGAIYGISSPRRLQRRLQTRQPLAKSSTASISPAAQPTPAPACPWS